MIPHTRLLLIALLLLTIASCTSAPLVPRGPVDDEAIYTSIHPYYLEFCALSEVEKKPDNGAYVRGGIGDHSTLYLNGACRVGNGYPELALCTGRDRSDGVGLSVNANFANTKWVAVPGRNFFYHGDIQPGQRLTRAVYDATKAHAKRLHLYDGIRYHDAAFDGMPPGYTRDDYKYEISIATDYAVGYGRDRYCARVPTTSAQMARVVAYINGINKPYRDGKAEYEWSVLTDNCIHFAHNALTEIGFWKLWPIHKFIIFAAFDFPVPKNEFINVLRRANDTDADDLLSVWNDVPTRRAVLDGDGLPIRDGALALLERVVQNNEVYDTNLRLIFYDDRVFGSYEGWYRQILQQPRYADMQANLQYFGALYQRIAAERQTLGWWLIHRPGLKSEPEFPAFYKRFYDEINHRTRSVGTETAAVEAAYQTRTVSSRSVASANGTISAEARQPRQGIRALTSMIDDHANERPDTIATTRSATTRDEPSGAQH